MKLVRGFFLIFFSIAVNAQVESQIHSNENISLTDSRLETNASQKSDVKNQTKESSEFENKTENEIPLNFENKKNQSVSENSVFKFLLFIAILGTLLTGVWVLLKKYKTQRVSKNHNEIKVLAQHYFGTKKSIAVVRIAGESLLVGITDNQINLIKSLSLLDDELPEVTPNDFSKIIKSKTRQETPDSEEELSEGEEFSIKGIKDIVSTKLKNMRSI
ncbi:MAG: flagellar biosynthetic protein FliO [Bdellovibrionaceae bacterium]|nr:flagellar biosynthetic protein FliO [Pseudobdellovibrionaceae bacterium]